MNTHQEKSSQTLPILEVTSPIDRDGLDISPIEDPETKLLELIRCFETPKEVIRTAFYDNRLPPNTARQCETSYIRCIGTLESLPSRLQQTLMARDRGVQADCLVFEFAIQDRIFKCESCDSRKTSRY